MENCNGVIKEMSDDFLLINGFYSVKQIQLQITKRKCPRCKDLKLKREFYEGTTRPYCKVCTKKYEEERSKVFEPLNRIKHNKNSHTLFADDFLQFLLKNFKGKTFTTMDIRKGLELQLGKYKSNSSINSHLRRLLNWVKVKIVGTKGKQHTYELAYYPVEEIT